MNTDYMTIGLNCVQIICVYCVTCGAHREGGTCVTCVHKVCTDTCHIHIYRTSRRVLQMPYVEHVARAPTGTYDMCGILYDGTFAKVYVTLGLGHFLVNAFSAIIAVWLRLD